MAYYNFIRCGIYALKYKDIDYGPYRYETLELLNFYLLEVPDCYGIKLNRYVHLLKDRLQISKGYAWDGATTLPAIRQLIVPSLVHDALCQIVESNLTTLTYSDADREFYLFMRMQGIGFFIAKTLYYGVHLLGPVYRSFLK